MRSARFLAWSLGTVIALTQCAPAPAADDPDPAGELVSFLAAEPGITDPQAAGNVDQLWLPLMVYEGLLRLDPKTLRPVPAAARELPTVMPDGRGYRFTLRDGLVYSDGARLTARDFAYGLSRLCDPNVQGFYASFAYIIVGCRDWQTLDPARESPQRLAAARDALFASGLRARSDTELEIVTTEPAAWLPAFLATWVSSPVREKDVTRGGDNWWNETSLYIGNGPFILAERVRDERIVLVANPKARVAPKLRKWTRPIAERAVAFDAYRHNEADLYETDPLTGASELALIRGDPTLRAELLEVPGSCTHYIRFNPTRPPFDDPKLRLALAKALDRDAFVTALGDGSPPAITFIPPGMPGHDPNDSAQRFDLPTARKLLAESRYAVPTVGPIRWLYTNPRQTAVIEEIARQWRANLGFDVAPELMTVAAFNDLVRGRPQNRPPLVWHGWCADYPDPQNYLSLFHSTQSIAPSYPFANATFDQLLRQADRETDPAKRDSLYLDASRLLSAEAPAVWVRNIPHRVLRKPWVQGLNFNALDGGGLLNPAQVYVTKAKKR